MVWSIKPETGYTESLMKLNGESPTPTLFLYQKRCELPRTKIDMIVNKDTTK
jgi:hypothetical protein